MRLPILAIALAAAANAAIQVRQDKTDFPGVIAVVVGRKPLAVAQSPGAF